MNDMVKNILIYAVLAFILMSVFNSYGPGSGNTTHSRELTYDSFISAVQDGRVAEADISGSEIAGRFSDGKTFKVQIPSIPDNGLIGDLLKNGVKVKGIPPEQPSFLMQFLMNWGPMIVLIGIYIFFMRQMQGGAGGKGAMSFGKSRARMLSEDQIKVTFSDVAGVEEAKEEVAELVEFLRDPRKFEKLGGKIPRGVLMVGSPGTGKTLLAKAIAGEAKVPFFTISGSDFVEMFVGVGASRVRDMFETAKKHAPCIIFIDEIDAVGRHRGAGHGGGNDEREQTLNQLLVEMDGFEGNEGVIVIAATNRPDVLDPALLRPGRFDRQVVVPLPDVRGREQILKVHGRKVPLGDDVKLVMIARGTPGFSGADLANLVNEAALFAARKNQTQVHMLDFEEAKDKIMMGAARKSMVMTDEEKKLTAYHESGHTIIGYLRNKGHPVYKVTIIPRGRALGVTMALPEKDQHGYSKAFLDAKLEMIFGGRIAEVLIYGEDGVTTGASNDIEKATELARNMVTKWGLSRLGAIAYAAPGEQPFLGMSASQHHGSISPDKAREVDEAVHVILTTAYERAEEMLRDNLRTLHAMTDALMVYETLDADQIREVMEGKTVTPPKGWEESDDTDGGSTGKALVVLDKPTAGPSLQKPAPSTE